MVVTTRNASKRGQRPPNDEDWLLPPEIILLISTFADDDTLLRMMACSKTCYYLLDPFNGFIKPSWEPDDDETEDLVQEDIHKCHWRKCGRDMDCDRCFKTHGLLFCSKMCRDSWLLC
jgi:hypothetical protein